MSAPAPLISLESLPRESKFHAHSWVDYIELLCLLNEDRQISREDVLSRIRDRRDLGEGLDDSEADPDVVTPVEAAGRVDITAAEEKDVHELRAASFFRHLQYREGVFGSFYPFKLSEEGDVLYAKERLSLRHRFYVFLLISSNLRYVVNTQWNTLTSSFESVSREALRKLMPETAQVHIFGKNILRHGRYRGNKWRKINRLKDDLYEELKVKEHHYDSYDLGDQGLDLVAWVPFGDSINGILIAFAQCACTASEWSRKQSSSSALAWNSTLTFMVFPTNFAFIPICFRDGSGNWHQPQKIHGSVVVDRVRLIYLLKDSYELFRTEPSREIVDRILKKREALV